MIIHILLVSRAVMKLFNYRETVWSSVLCTTWFTDVPDCLNFHIRSIIQGRQNVKGNLCISVFTVSFYL